MATIHSLVCWGGLTGKTVTADPATDIFTLTNHGNRDSSKRWFASGIPAGLSYVVPYYTKSLSANTFELYTDSALTTKALFTSAGSSPKLLSDIVADPSSALAPYGLSDLTRWDSRIYDGLVSANSARSTNGLSTDDEVIEFAEAFTETAAAQQNIGYGFANSYTFWSRVNGIRSAAFHNGLPGAGYVFYANAVGCLYTSQVSVTVDGLDWVRNSTSSATTNSVCSASYGGNIFRYNIVRNVGTGLCHGIVALAAQALVHHNIVIGIHPGATTVGGIAVNGGAVVYNNTVTKCGVGMLGYSGGGSYAGVYNNLVVGNDINYGGAAVFAATRAAGNIGEITDRISFTATAGSSTLVLSSPPALLNINQQVFLETDGTLPAPLLTTRSYYIRSISGSNITVGTAFNGSAIVMTNSGSGTHKMSLVWATSAPPGNYIDFTDPDDVFMDWANNDLRPAGYGTATPGAEARMVDSALYINDMVDPAVDILGKERPNYNNGGAEGKDVGAFEFDHGYGPRPALTEFAFTVKDESGVGVTDFEYRLYLKDPAAGIIGSTELDGAENYTSSSRTWQHGYSTSTDVVLQIIKDGYEEALVEYTLNTTPQNTTVYLVTERNI